MGYGAVGRDPGRLRQEVKQCKGVKVRLYKYLVLKRLGVYRNREM